MLSAASGLIVVAGCSSGGSEAGGSGDFRCPDDIVPAANTEFCASVAATPDCDRSTPGLRNQVCGVALKQPPLELERSLNVKKFAGSGPPDLGCFA
jgi:hypothetical protein